MPVPTLPELLDQYGSLDKIPEDKLRAVGYERVQKEGSSATSTVVEIRRIGAKPPKPFTPPEKRSVDGRRIPNPNWAWGSGPEKPVKKGLRRG